MNQNTVLLLDLLEILLTVILQTKTMTEPDDKSHDTVDHLDKNYNHVIFSSDDQRLKILGEIFGNNTSRNIITALIETEMTAM